MAPKPYQSSTLYTMPVGSRPSTLGDLFATSTIFESCDVMRLYRDEIHHFISNQHRRYHPVVLATHGELVRLPHHLLYTVAGRWK